MEFPFSLLRRVFLALVLAGNLPAWAQGPADAGSLCVTDFGAVGDGAMVNTAALQKAIDTCSTRGGGVVRFPPGQFVTGTVQLKDGVTLSLDPKASILGSTNMADYRNLDPFHSGSDGAEEMGYALIVAKDAKNVGVIGAGVIDGRGAALKKTLARYDRRPFLMRWVRCNGVTVRDVELTGSGAWTLNFFQSKNVTVDHIHLHCVGLGNNDGIDLDSTRSAVVKDCVIESGDDSLCFKATSPVACGDIQVTGCRLRSSQAGIKFGTESMGDFAHITISDCHIQDSYGGIYLFSVDGSHLHDIAISDVTMEKVANPIMIRLGARLKTFRPGQTPLPVGSLSGVTVRDLACRGCGSPGILVSGLPGHPIENLTLDEIRIELPGGGRSFPAGRAVPENPNGYPTPGMFGNLPAYGAYLRHVKSGVVAGLTLALRAPDPREAVVADDATGLVIKDSGARPRATAPVATP